MFLVTFEDERSLVSALPAMIEGRIQAAGVPIDIGAPAERAAENFSGHELIPGLRR